MIPMTDIDTTMTKEQFIARVSVWFAPDDAAKVWDYSKDDLRDCIDRHSKPTFRECAEPRRDAREAMEELWKDRHSV